MRTNRNRCMIASDLGTDCSLGHEIEKPFSHYLETSTGTSFSTSFESDNDLVILIGSEIGTEIVNEHDDHVEQERGNDVAHLSPPCQLISLQRVFPHQLHP